MGYVVKFVMKIHKCDDPVTINIKVQLGSFTWQHNFKGDELVKIPKLPAIPLVGVSLKVHIHDTGEKLEFRVSIGFSATVTPLVLTN